MSDEQKSDKKRRGLKFTELLLLLFVGYWFWCLFFAAPR